MLPASASSSSSLATSAPLPAAIPLKFRRKSQGSADIESYVDVYQRATRASAQCAWRDPYSSDASSPIAATAALPSEPSSPVDFAQIHRQSSPAYGYEIRARDVYDYPYDRQGSWKAIRSHSLLPSPSYYYAMSRQPYSPRTPSFGSSISYSPTSEGSEDPPMTSDFDMDMTSVYSDDTSGELGELLSRSFSQSHATHDLGVAIPSFTYKRGLLGNTEFGLSCQSYSRGSLCLGTICLVYARYPQPSRPYFKCP